MTDNGDGTYQYTFRVDKEGMITYKIILPEAGKVSVDYSKLDGTFLGKTNVSNIFFDYGTGVIYKIN